jgi:hypothetical protein
VSAVARAEKAGEAISLPGPHRTERVSEGNRTPNPRDHNPML